MGCGTSKGAAVGAESGQPCSEDVGPSGARSRKSVRVELKTLSEESQALAAEVKSLMGTQLAKNSLAFPKGPCTVCSSGHTQGESSGTCSHTAKALSPRDGLRVRVEPTDAYGKARNRSMDQARNRSMDQARSECSRYSECASLDGTHRDSFSAPSTPPGHSFNRHMSKTKHQPLATVPLTTGVAAWKVRGRSSCGSGSGNGGTKAAPTTPPHGVWLKPTEGSWLGDSTALPVGDHAYEVSFRVSAAEAAHFRLQYAVDNMMKGAYLNGRLLDSGSSVGFQGLNRQMSLRAPPGEGLFCYGENRLKVVITNTGSSHNPGGFYLLGEAYVALDLTTGEALWQIANDHGAYPAGTAAPRASPGPDLDWMDPERGSWIGSTEAWPSGTATLSLQFEVAVPDMACFELPCSLEGGVLKAAHLNGRSLSLRTASAAAGPSAVVIEAPQGQRLFVPGVNYLTVAVETTAKDEGPFGFYAQGLLDVAVPSSSSSSSSVAFNLEKTTAAQQDEPAEVILLPADARRYQASGPQVLPGLVWMTVFRQTMPYLWGEEQGVTGPLNPGDPEGANFSLLNMLEDCRGGDGLFTFMYRDEYEGQYVVWEQSSNPATSDSVSGFRVLHWGPNSEAQDAGERSRFRGLALSATGKCVLDGNTGSENWWFSVGARESHEGSLPGIRMAREKLASRTELLVAVAPRAAEALVAKTVAALPHPPSWKSGASAEEGDPDLLAKLAALQDALEEKGYELDQVREASKDANDLEAKVAELQKSLDDKSSELAVLASAHSGVASGVSARAAGAVEEGNVGASEGTSGQERLTELETKLAELQGSLDAKTQDLKKAQKEAKAMAAASNAKGGPELSEVDMTTGEANWRQPRAHGDLPAGDAPLTEPHDDWLPPVGGSWLGHATAWPSATATFVLEFDVSAPEWARFELSYEVSHTMKSATLNGKPLQFGKLEGGYGDTVINAPAGKGLFFPGSNVLAVTVDKGESSGGIGFYAIGSAKAVLNLGTGIATWRQPRSHGRFQAGEAPTTPSNDRWYKPLRGQWLGNSSAWPSGNVTFMLDFKVPVAELASFELPYTADGAVKSANLNGKALEIGGPVSCEDLDDTAVIMAPQGHGLFIPGNNVLTVTITPPSTEGGQDSPFGFYAKGCVRMGLHSNNNQPSAETKAKETQPAIPEVLVLDDADTRKYQAGGAQIALPGLVWIVAFRQTAPYVWEEDQPLWLNPLDPTKPNYSILHFLEDCRDSNGSFTFTYRDEYEGQYVVWEQSSNPATTSDKVSGFKVLQWGPNSTAQKAEEEANFCGLALSETHCVMDGNAGSSWWYSVGAYEQHKLGAFPGIRQAKAELSLKVELLVAMKPEAVEPLVSKIAEFVQEQVVELEGPARNYQVLTEPSIPGLVWISVFKQSLPHLWKKGSPLALSPNDPDNPNFSILDLLEACRCNDGQFRFMYRDQRDDQYVVWQQSTNPATTVGTVGDFKELEWGPAMKGRDSRFRGLALTGSKNCLISGYDGAYWWYSMGAYKRWDGGFPGLQLGLEPRADSVQLLVAVPLKAAQNLLSSMKVDDGMAQKSAAEEPKSKGAKIKGHKKPSTAAGRSPRRG